MHSSQRRSLPPVSSKVLRNGFQGLLEEGPSTISISLRPMEELYTFQAVSLSNAIAYMKAKPSSRLRVDLADLEFDMQRGLGFLPYSKDSRSSETCDRISDLVDASSSLDPSIAQRVSIWRFSERLAADPGFMDHVLKLFEKKSSREAKILISRKTGKSTHLPMAPICPSCSHASSSFGILSPDRMKLGAYCGFKDCADYGNFFMVDIRRPGSFCLFYLFDSIGDSYADPSSGRTQVHMLGIDSKRNWGTGMAMHEVIGRLTALPVDDNYCPSYFFTMRLVESASLHRKSKFSAFLAEQGISPSDALRRMVSIAERFDGRSELSLETLKAPIETHGLLPNR